MERLRKPVHPGRVFLLDVLTPLGLSITDAAQMMGITRKAGLLCRQNLTSGKPDRTSPASCGNSRRLAALIAPDIGP